MIYLFDNFIYLAIIFMVIKQIISQLYHTIPINNCYNTYFSNLEANI